jgi:predicted HicB family RNase H-like nuclease
LSLNTYKPISAKKVPSELSKDIRLIALKLDMSLNDAIVEALRDYAQKYRHILDR